MPDTGSAVLLVIDQGEDYVAQFIYTDDYGNPMQLTGSGALRMHSTIPGVGDIVATPASDTAGNPALQITPDGFVTFSIPASVTSILVSSYDFDMVVEAVDNSVFASRAVKLVSGQIQVNPTLTQPSDLAS